MTELAIVGDGPAGSALALECAERGVDVALIGRDEPWTATYASWTDDVPERWRSTLGWTTPSIAVHADRTHPIAREYGVFDNGALRAALRAAVTHVRASVEISRSSADGSVLALDDGREVAPAIVVDATGWPPALATPLAPARDRYDVAYQTAFGVVLEDPPKGDLGEPTWMDFRDPGTRPADRSVPTFCYALPVADGWLVEETVLAARPAVEPVALLPRLGRRLGRQPDELLDAAVRTEYVRIPMSGGTLPWRTRGPTTFGAAAGYVNPVSGFSVAASLRRAPIVADALAAATSDRARAATLGETVWPRAMRRTRALHEFGLEALLGLDQAGVRTFFDRFFDAPVGRWAPYLRIDAPPTEVSSAMVDLFRAAPWWLRRHLAVRNPLPLRRAVSG